MFARTKEKVYEVVEENERYYKCCYDDGCITLVAKFDNDVNGFSKALKTADNIADLCDMYVYVEADKMPCVAGLRINTKQYKLYADFCLVNHIDLYGAIWTDKGLIYVAKMNENGELELI